MFRLFLDNVKKVEAGSEHFAAIRADGSLWVCGRNNYGELGLGDFDKRNTPVKNELIPDPVIDVACAEGKTLVLTSKGELFGFGKYVVSENPVNIPIFILDNVIKVKAGKTHALALRADGTVWAWGENMYGEVGIGTMEPCYTPVPVLAQVIDIAAGTYCSFAITFDGKPWVWGGNYMGMFGNPDIIFAPTPTPLFGGGQQ